MQEQIEKIKVEGGLNFNAFRAIAKKPTFEENYHTLKFLDQIHRT